MFELEVVIVVICLRTEPNLLHLLFLLILLRLFLFFLLRIKELLVVHNTAHRRVGSRSNLDQVEVLFIGNMHCLLERVDTLFYIVADKAYLQDTADFVINTMRVLFDNATATRSGSNSCYMFNYLWLIIPLVRAGTLCPTIEKACKVTTFFAYVQEFL